MLRLKKNLFILSLIIFTNKINSGIFDLLFSSSVIHQNTSSTTTTCNPQASNIKENVNITIDEKTTLETIKKLLSQILEEIKKGHFNIFNVNLQNGNAISSVINNENLNNLNNKNTNTNQINLSQHLINIKNKASNQLSLFKNWLANNKTKISFLIMSSAYIALNYKLINLTFKLSNQNNWSNWQTEKTLEDFYKVPQSTFATTLLKDVQNFYMQINNITDYVTPISKFIIDIHKEIKNINTYVKIIETLKRFKINNFFAYSNNLYLKSTDKLNRLLFIKNVFLSWLADHKLSHFKILKKSKILNKLINVSSV